MCLSRSAGAPAVHALARRVSLRLLYLIKVEFLNFSHFSSLQLLHTFLGLRDLPDIYRKVRTRIETQLTAHTAVGVFYFHGPVPLFVK